jgi:ADP-ribose diphosphatase
MKIKPIITNIREVARSHLFKIEAMDLEFSNGVKRTYERLVAGPNGAVMIVPIFIDPGTKKTYFLLIREYSGGTHDYQLAFPKGLMETGEKAEESAHRELMEEVGYGAKTLSIMKKMSLAPGYLTHKMNLVLAEDLYLESREGDEPEPLEVVKWPINEIDSLIEQPDFTEARSIAALFLAKQILDKRLLKQVR